MKTRTRKLKFIFISLIEKKDTYCWQRVEKVLELPAMTEDMIKLS